MKDNKLVGAYFKLDIIHGKTIPIADARLDDAVQRMKYNVQQILQTRSFYTYTPPVSSSKSQQQQQKKQ